MTPEGYILDACMDLLQAKRVFAMRMNVGSFTKGRHTIRFGIPGQADVLAFPITAYGPHPLWLEMKTEKGKQSELQKSFQKKVEAEMHAYAVVRSVDELEAILKRICQT